MLEEAEVELNIACLISISTGKLATINVPKPDFFQRNVVAIDVIKAMVGIATDCEKTAEDMEKKFRHLPKTYFRFNVEQGLQTVKLGDWDRMDEVAAHTQQYMKISEVDQRLATAVQAIRAGKRVIQTSASTGMEQDFLC